MDIIVTTPKSLMAAVAQEAAHCIADGGGEYFRRFTHPAPMISPLERVYYVEDGYVRGFAIVSRTTRLHRGAPACATTGREWGPGFYVFMLASSWQWIEPIPMRGFQGFRYARYAERLSRPTADVKIVGGWLDPKPSLQTKGCP